MNAVTEFRHGLLATCLGGNQLGLLLVQRGLLARQLLQGAGNARLQFLQLAQGVAVAGDQFIAGVEK